MLGISGPGSLRRTSGYHVCHLLTESLDVRCPPALKSMFLFLRLPFVNLYNIILIYSFQKMNDKLQAIFDF